MAASEIDNFVATSLSDDEDDLTPQQLCVDSRPGWLITGEQCASFQDDGYCQMDADSVHPLTLDQVKQLITGFILPLSDSVVSVEIPRLILEYVYFASSDHVMQLQSGGHTPSFFLIPRVSMKLAGLIDGSVVSFEANQVPAETLHHVVKYLAHHRGKEPDPLPCPVRSIHMSQIVSDKWDATFIDACDKKTTFEIILAANYMEIKSLVHLGAAKIATLIKQLDQKEINRIIEEEEKYRREHASIQSDRDEHGDTDGVESDGDVDEDGDDDCVLESTRATSPVYSRPKDDPSSPPWHPPQ